MFQAVLIPTVVIYGCFSFCKMPISFCKIVPLQYGGPLRVFSFLQEVYPFL